MRWFESFGQKAALVAVIALSLTGASTTHTYSPREKAFYADKAVVDFARPGLVITINSASISTSGVISVTYTLTDPSGLPLDAAGVNTPGVVSLAYVAAYIPKGQEQYVAYTTAAATGKALGTITRPDFELGGTATQVAPGQYQYTFQAQAPSGFDPTVTTTVAVDGNRDLTSFNLGVGYAGTTFNFVPNGSAVTVTRDVISHTKLQLLPRPIGVPRRLCAWHGDVCPLPPAAKLGSGYRQLAGRQGLLSQAAHGVATAQCRWHGDHTWCSL